MLEDYILPEKCCLHCEFGELVEGNRVKCHNDSSYYFHFRMAKKDHCPDCKVKPTDEKE